jgi:hypothetical protein
MDVLTVSKENIMRTGLTGGLRWAAAVLAGVSLGGCRQSPIADEGVAGAAVSPGVVVDRAPAPGESVRAGGDLLAAITGTDGNYRAGPCWIDTPLPEGYPAPTPPGAIDLKTYPSVRVAEVAGAGHPDRGMNRTFWPLFNHIKKHDIAMTSPVEMYYEGLEGSGPPAAWSMAFLYRTPELNETGTEGEVVVRDAPPVTVVSVGVRGDYAMSLVERGMREIEAWLGDHPEWKAAGDWRCLYYNGPALRFWNKWAEVQIPVTRVQEEGGTPWKGQGPA